MCSVKKTVGSNEHSIVLILNVKSTNSTCISHPTVSRLIKYTGYGNAAGLLAHRGLMMGHPEGYVSAYSSDSDSETEEYKEAQHR